MSDMASKLKCQMYRKYVQNVMRVNVLCDVRDVANV